MTLIPDAARGAWRLALRAGMLTVALAGIARGHAGLEREIAEVTAAIAERPADASLLLRRGELHREHRDWPQALADYDRAAGLDPELAAVDFCRGRLYVEAGLPARAVAALDLFLGKQPDHAAARLWRARALAALDRPLDAAGDYRRALAADPRPQPDHFLELARVLSGAGPEHRADAVRALDEGLTRLGPVVSLELAAVELETDLGRYDAALARLARAAAASPRQETWLARRGDLLARAGRPAEARAAYDAALAALRELPDRLRHAPQMRQLEIRIGHALEKTGPPHPVSVIESTAEPLR